MPSIEDDDKESGKTETQLGSLQDESGSEESFRESDDENSKPTNALYYSAVHGITWLPIGCQQIIPGSVSSHSRIGETSGSSNLAQRNFADGVVRRA